MGEAFGSDTSTVAPSKKGRAPLTLNGKTLSPKAWVKLDLAGQTAQDYSDYKDAERVLRDRFLNGLKARHLPDDKAGKYGIMLSMKGDKPSYVICDKAAAGSSEAFSF